MKTLKTLLVAGTLVVVAAPALALTPKDLAPHYVCDGTNPSGEMYRVMLDIAPLSHVIAVRWTFEGGGEIVGIGLIRRNQFIVASALGSAPILVVYERKGMTLVGTWGGVGVDRLFPESCRQAAQGPAQAPRTPRHGAGVTTI